jgi:adenosylcobinamide-GDP ribazoletransferase
MSTLRDGWRLAIGSLTIWPSGPVRPSAKAVRVMIAVAPVAVLPLALGAAALVRGGDLLGVPGLVIGLLVVGWLAFSSRAMHVDGLADVSDGIGGGWEPARARAILKRGDTGPMGVAALIIVLGLQAACIGALAQQPGGWLLAGVTVAVSRWLLAAVCRVGLPPMPGSRLGVNLVGALRRWQAWLWLVLIPASLGLAAYAAGLPWAQGVAAGFVGIALAALLVRRCVRVFEGVNGDVMGAVIEVGLTAMLVALVCS